MNDHFKISRRDLLSASAVAGTVLLSRPVLALETYASQAQPFALDAVRLKPSIFLNAVEANKAYLHSLSPDRLLHNFRQGAGLKPKADVYGGWESRGIAGHSLGHYLTACALMYAQTGDAECAQRAKYIVDELAQCQAAHGDGYVGGTTVERDGRVIDGKIVYEEVKRGEIRSSGFDLNGGWVPLYTWHKVHAGLLDVHQYLGHAKALTVAVGMSSYLADVLEPLTESQLQQVLASEHGGLNEVYADMFARTGNRRWLALAERIYHRKVLDPIVAGRDELEGLHANTQIPKVLGLARLFELTGNSRFASGPQFFWQTVTRDHSYVIGGNSEREHFGKPRQLAHRLTDQTCEACNTYNMLKLTRHLYSWQQPDASYFDYYERAHLNHIMSQQDPATGLFTYMTPMMSGVERRYSTPTESFWCCVGSGMESHSKHGDSVYWHNDDTLFVNLYYASELHWRERDTKVEMLTDYPLSESVRLRIVSPGRKGMKLALRIPHWCEAPEISVNGKRVATQTSQGYATLTRAWRSDDVVELKLPMPLRIEPTPDDRSVVAFVSGPLVLAASLGAPLPPGAPVEIPPALIVDDPSKALSKQGEQLHAYSTGKTGRPKAMDLSPFFSQYHQRTAIYFPMFSEAQWQHEEASYNAAHAERAALEARIVDRVFLGEMQPERDHELKSDRSEAVTYLGNKGRILQGPGFFEVTMQATAEPLILQAVYWGEERNRDIDILVDGKVIANERRAGTAKKDFEVVEYAIPAVANRTSLKLKFQQKNGNWTSIYGCRLLKAPASV